MKIRTLCLMLLCSILSLGAQNDYPVGYEVSWSNNFGNSNLAPYYVTSNSHGIYSQSNATLLRAKVFRPLELDKKISYSFCADVIGGAESKATYLQYSIDKDALIGYKRGIPAAWIQQLYGEFKYRSLFLTVGMKEHESALYNNQLGTGDFIESGNSRPMPEIRAGLIDFRDIPFTNGWAQIQGEYSFAKQLDGNWLKDHYNYYSHFLTTDSYYSYKRIYFRSKPSERFSVTVGMQTGVQLGGKYKTYEKGIVTQETDLKINFKAFIRTIIPGSGSTPGNDVYYEGNTVGCWDLMTRYRLFNNDEIKAYVQMPFEDGSGIGKLNGFDGVWGLEYKSSRKRLIHGAVLEYINFRNQSGPIHWAPGDHDNSPINTPATGADNYYNNFQYNGYQYYGMSIGTPFLQSPIYNTDGYMQFVHNRVEGFQLGLMGTLAPQFDYRLLVSYRNSLGTPFVPLIKKSHDTSVMLEGKYSLKPIPNLEMKGMVAMDRGNMYGNKLGVLFTVSYRGILNF